MSTQAHNASGLFENPHIEETQQQQEQSIIQDIKDDTSAIREAIYKHGGVEVATMEEFNRLSRENRKAESKENQQLTEMYKKGILLSPKTLKHLNSSKNKQNKALPTKSDAQTIRTHVKKSVKTTAQKIQEKREKEQKSIKRKENVQAFNSTQKQESKAQLPNGWQRDINGRIRDKNGKYVSEKELRQNGLKNPEKVTNQDKNDTKKEASERRILDVLGGIKDAVNGAENVDPMVNAAQEIAEPVKGLFNVGKALTLTSVSMGKRLFQRDPTKKRWRDKFFGMFSKSAKTDEKQQNRIVDWLRRIWKKNDGSGVWLGKLLMGLALIPKFFKGGFVRLLGGLFGSKLGRIFAFALTPFKKIGGLFAYFGKAIGLDKLFGKGSGLFKNFGKLISGLGKGFLKRIPILGSLLAFVDGGMAGGIGSIIGGVIGSAFGPIGTIIGALFGEKIGAWLAVLDWKTVGNWITEKWTNLTTWFSDTWKPISQWFSTLWKDTTKYFSNKWEKVTDKFSEIWGDTKKWITDKWDNAVKSFTDIWNTISDWFAKLIPDWVKDGVEKVSESVSNTYSTTQNWVSEKYDNAKQWMSDMTNNVVNSVNNFFSSGVDKKTSLAADFATINAASKSLSQCAKYVNDALRSQGIQSYGHGKDVANNLLKSRQGFSEVQYSKDYQPQIGDVMSIPSYQGAKHNYGHVAIYTKNGWVSDFQQGEKYGNTASANAKYYEAINSGQIKPTIARRTSNKTISQPYAINSNGQPIPQNNQLIGASLRVGNSALNYTKFSGFGADVDNYIKEASERYGIDEKVLRGFVKMEGGWTDKMSATGAIGIGQFTRDTWNDLANTPEGKSIGMTQITEENFRTVNDPRYNKRINTLATGLLARNNAQMLQKKGLEATGENLYMAHNIGVGGFIHAMQGRASEAEMRKMRVNGMKAGMTPQEFVAYQKRRFQQHYNIANGISPIQQAMNNAINLEKKVPTMYWPTIPSAPQIQNVNYDKMAQQAIQSIPKLDKPKSEITNDNLSVAMLATDPIYQFLTQDVSERRIAHIVTGGLVRLDNRI